MAEAGQKIPTEDSHANANGKNYQDSNGNTNYDEQDIQKLYQINTNNNTANNYIDKDQANVHKPGAGKGLYPFNDPSGDTNLLPSDLQPPYQQNSTNLQQNPNQIPQISNNSGGMGHCMQTISNGNITNKSAHQNTRSKATYDKLLDAEAELKKQKRLKNKIYYSNIQEDYSKTEYNEEDRINHAQKSAYMYNQRLLNLRQETKQLMETIEENKLNSRFPIDSINSAIHSHQIPIMIYTDNGNSLYDINEALNPGQASIEKFIQLNVHNENNRNYSDIPRSGIYYNKPQRIIHRRRKRGTLKPIQRNF